MLERRKNDRMIGSRCVVPWVLGMGFRYVFSTSGA